VQDAERVEITIPARAEFVSVARLTAATVAARLGFSYDEIEDLKIAVGEACTSLILSGADPGQPLRLRFILDRDTLQVAIEARGPGIVLHSTPAAGATSADDLALDERRLGVFLMQCLVDEVDAIQHDATGVAELRLVKRHQG
jgi:serine/threonine-protein kinase RsbW